MLDMPESELHLDYIIIYSGIHSFSTKAIFMVLQRFERQSYTFLFIWQNFSRVFLFFCDISIVIL